MSESAEIAGLKVKVEHLETKIEDMAKDMKSVVTTLAEIRGGKRVLWAVWSFLGIGAGIIGTYLTVRGR